MSKNSINLRYIDSKNDVLFATLNLNTGELSIGSNFINLSCLKEAVSSQKLTFTNEQTKQIYKLLEGL